MPGIFSPFSRAGFLHPRGDSPIAANRIESFISAHTFLRNGNVVTTATPGSGFIRMNGGSGANQQDHIFATNTFCTRNQQATAIFSLIGIALPGTGNGSPRVNVGLHDDDTGAGESAVEVQIKNTAAGPTIKLETRTIINGSYVVIALTDITTANILIRIRKDRNNIFDTAYSNDAGKTWTVHATGIDLGVVTDNLHPSMEAQNLDGGGEPDVKLNALYFEAA